ncbi:hypothetical protein [Aureivirga marina]|uniref:hypothetical protein n=1 Tax=Aureivirga marina TaxID=1182451 RepID=UPI0018C9B034|nr:hypothetical protein [Aureivirga marina]
MKDLRLFSTKFVVVFLLLGNTSFAMISENLNKQNLPPKKEIVETQKTEILLGNWYVDYNDKNYKGRLVYEIKKSRADIYNAFLKEYNDENGNVKKANDEKVLLIKSFNGKRGKGIYLLKYQGERYNVNCTIELKDKNTFVLKYNYYGYKSVETWKRKLS